ncbi:hypothetical protein [Pseudoalteromonas luteoviolacea]|uniref:Uncharacterized protein n=1 Tax=Pseudoalteromonas luteoviolacea H33 TaxID=1365251 RepID=A0A162AFY1_9GAMM|nr:hypothetical protein [Pseudoalteromonas luteoviolacea]KZN49028.1 hypothetical protein N476_02980 [Pseudoalteromonas luteoviolacea H33]KZN74298.1 hypothetical protein N477_01945 [Pseudoalteromonas luteoviolacea H33-S]MBQ4878510.1 hypothetical protein [Pseudoalteromonas luteoviolacea]MBQ4907665.1 hypothetical protein [Pseudoalteromonas luteoviolacea]
MKFTIKKKRIKNLSTEHAINTQKTKQVAGGAVFQSPDTDFSIGQQNTCKTA